MTTPHPPVELTGWPLWQRVGFRYLLLHWLLYAFTDPQGNPLISFMGAIRFWLAKPRQWGWTDVDLTGWSTDVSHWLHSAQGSKLDYVNGVVGTNHGWCLRFTSWLSEASAHLNNGEPWFEVHHQPTGSGDTMHDLVKLCAIMVVAGMLTILWSALDRRDRAYPRLGRWLHLFARWYVALQMLGYGMAKFYGMTQFPEPGIAALTREVGDHSPMGMVWTFMGASAPYKYFGGAGELLGFALLLHRRTTLLGCFVTVGVMTNVCALNFLYGVPVKLYSGHLLLIALLLMLPFRERLWGVFISNRSTPPVDLRVTHSRWLGWPLLTLGLLWAAGLLWSGHESRTKMYEHPRYAKMMAKPQLYGLWKVERMLLDGKSIPTSDSSRWRYLAIDRGHYATARTLLGQAFSFAIQENLDANEVTLKPRYRKDPSAVWTIERSTVTRKVRNPNPKTVAEKIRPIDGPVPAIVFKGMWRGKSLELHTVRKQFRLHEGFRLVREFPR